MKRKFHLAEQFWPLTCDDDLDEVSVPQLVMVREPLQQLIRTGLMSEQQNLLPDAHHAAVWSLKTKKHPNSRNILNLNSLRGCSNVNMHSFQQQV